MTAQDVGNTAPGDAGDVTPSTPTDGSIVDYTVPTPLPSNKFTLAEPALESGITEIDVRTTPIKDGLQLLETTLSTLLAVESDENEVHQLTLKLLGLLSGVVDGETKLARVPYYYDFVDNFWRSPTVFIAEIIEVKDDYLICRRLKDGVVVEDTDPDDGTDDSLINVVKNYKLQRTPFDDETVNGLSYEYSSDVTRLATVVDSNPVEQEEQVIVPEYVGGDPITIARLIDPVTVENLLDTEGVKIPINYQDQNTDARAWARRDDV